MGSAMTDEPEASALGSDPRARPQRCRTACAASLGEGVELAGTVLRATAELAEIGLTLTARALRGALARLPRP